MIKFNYKEAMKHAAELEEISEEMNQLVSRELRTAQAELGNTWSGESAEIFMRKSEELLKDITKTAKTAAGIAGAVEIAAKALEAAENAAKEIIGAKS